MENIIIIFVIAIIAAIGVRSTVRHFKGQGGCCGGSSYKPKKKKLAQTIYQKSFRVDGMHCENCKKRVEEVVNDIKGVAGRVNLGKGELTVAYEEDVEDELIMSRIRKAGYIVTEING